VVGEVDVSPAALFRGDPGDLTELLGNLLDNAYKYCRSRVRVSAHAAGDRLAIVVDDDGRGIDDAFASALFERGKRADESVPGQGIGLAVVREIVELYHGDVGVARSALGGAQIRVELGRAGAL
jgi:two-component system sensor histidine kinase PhoQ